MAKGHTRQIRQEKFKLLSTRCYILLTFRPQHAVSLHPVFPHLTISSVLVYATDYSYLFTIYLFPFSPQFVKKYVGMELLDLFYVDSALPEQFLDVPYAPFGKGDRIGRAADFTAPVYFQNRSFRECVNKCFPCSVVLCVMPDEIYIFV